MALDDTVHCDALKLAEVIRHVDACPHCKAELIGYQRLIASLRPRVPEVPPHRIAMLESAVRAEVARIRRHPRIVRWAVGIAVAAAIVAACVLLWPTGSTQPGEGPETVAHGGSSTIEPELGPKLGRPASEIIKEIVSLRDHAEHNIKARHFGEAVRDDLTNAKRLARTLITAVPDSQTALKAQYELYRCYELLGEDYQRERAFKGYIEQIRARDGKQAAAKALVVDAHRLTLRTQLGRAGRRLARALELCPTGPIGALAHALQAGAHERQRAFGRAYREYQMALELKPSLKLESSIRYRMVKIKVLQGQLDTAIAEARALCMLPEDPDGPGKRAMHQCLLARIYERKGDLVSAVREFNSAIAQSDPVYSDYAATQIKRLRAKAMDMD